MKCEHRIAHLGTAGAGGEGLKGWMKRRHSFWRCPIRLFAAILIGFFLGTIVLIEVRSRSIGSAALEESPLPPPPPPPPPPPGVEKIAFLFIARNRLPLDVVWDAFFKGDKEGRFSVFVHSRPGFLFNEATTRSAFFYGRQVNDSVQVDWGQASMIQAERILLKSALEDLDNKRFVFISDSCIPLYNFNYVYDYIMSSSSSFVDSFADKKESRYNPKMHPVVPAFNWRKGSQWAVLIRKHAKVVLRDETVFPVFEQHCRRKPLPEFWREHPLVPDASKLHNCIPDEHYVQTLLAQAGLEEEITRRSLTHTSWEVPAYRGLERHGWHPVTYKLLDATPKLIRDIKKIDHINYETEYRKEWCSSHGKPANCFLFARKFTRSAALRLLLSGALGFK